MSGNCLELLKSRVHGDVAAAADVIAICGGRQAWSSRQPELQDREFRITW
jgi:hypothetical protein